MKTHAKLFLHNPHQKLPYNSYEVAMRHSAIAANSGLCCDQAYGKLCAESDLRISKVIENKELFTTFINHQTTIIRFRMALKTPQAKVLARVIRL